ncbi:hypothetical protein [Variovorax saccharolyticus]|uniref:hypothetical protein n=1 Tax=Variovorax saccharolyticus TaxID=3053516 RepID=UPI002576CBC7|nr:hypothetical protein [Variovorax sp. J22R187]MDM0022644.1 hypothetical protein [Variovorax sp. J22R187]
MYRYIGSIDDLAQVPDEELAQCMAALRKAIETARTQHLQDIRDGRVPKNARFHFEAYHWLPRQSRIAHPHPEMQIDDMPFRPAVRDALHDLGIYRVVDLTLIRAEELFEHPCLAPESIVLLSEMLRAAGLDFLDGARSSPPSHSGLEPANEDAGTNGQSTGRPAARAPKAG